MPAVLLSPNPDGLSQAAAFLIAGALVAFPTETVYGLGGDARNDHAVAQIFAAKGRPTFNPLIVHVSDLAAAERLVVFDDQALRLAHAFWPGPLTLVLPARADAGLAPLVSAGLPTVAIRVPAHPLAQALLRAFGGPIAAPSANPSGKISPTRPDHVMAGLGEKIAGVIDGGACGVGVESTILGFDPRPTLLRPGGLPAEAIADCLGTPLALPSDPGARPISPGQLASHYAPEARLRLAIATPELREVWLGFGPDCHGCQFNLSPTGDLTEAAANLFHYLRQADASAGPQGRIAVAPIPETGLGRAINDRLRRAAAPR